jgi:mRNA interferase RelE/StbE
LVWTIEISDQARKQLRKLNRWQADQIATALADIARLENPRVRGKPMIGNFTGFWRYRVGDWRAIVEIAEGRMVLILIAVGHRRDVYN